MPTDDPLSRYDTILDDPDAFHRVCNRPLPRLTRINTIKTSRDRVTTALDETGIDWTPRSWNQHLLELATDEPGTTWPYFLGWLHGQEEVSTLPPRVLAPQPGDRILDACAAPGSKATQLAALADDTAFIVANDVNLGRLSALRSNAERLGVSGLAVTNKDARNFSLKPFDFDAFDRTLVDAPCSGEGTVRKNPDALENWSESALSSLAGVQKGILTRAIQATAPGGVVVYATCTFAPEENEAVLDYVLDTEPCDLVAFDIPLDHDPGITDWQGERFDDRVQRTKRIYPHHNDTGGFFLAKLEVGE
ncbi:MAG: RsmB/NOP family class I SAM-dependent RNA methyltransferase [Halobacteriales archaeon]